MAEKGKITEQHEEALYKIAKWMRASGEQYAPISCVKHMNNHRTLLKDLKKWGLIGLYKKEDAAFPTDYGWKYVIGKNPDLARRGRTIHYD